MIAHGIWSGSKEILRRRDGLEEDAALLLERRRGLVEVLARSRGEVEEAVEVLDAQATEQHPDQRAVGHAPVGEGRAAVRCPDRRDRRHLLVHPIVLVLEQLTRPGFHEPPSPKPPAPRAGARAVRKTTRCVTPRGA
jgi:hypothetical protein